jgi:Tfp pilus assembly protein PilX
MKTTPAFEPSAEIRRPRLARPLLPPSRGERGSAFTVALLVLVVLTIGGLILTLITQTEMRIGTNERTTNRSLYATDSGIQVAAARNLWNGTTSDPVNKLTFFLNTTTQDTGVTSPSTTFSDQVTVTPLVPLTWMPSAFGQVNQNTPNYLNITYVVNSTSSRVGVAGTTTQTVATKTLSSMIGIQPAVQQGAQANGLATYNSTTGQLLF